MIKEFIGMILMIAGFISAGFFLNLFFIGAVIFAVVGTVGFFMATKQEGVLKTKK